MAKVTVIFVGGNTLVDEVIEKVTSGEYSHTAIKILGGVLESTGEMKAGDRYPGVHMRPVTEFDGNPYATFVDIDIPDLQAAESKAKKLLNRFYSYIGCFEGGIHSLLGIDLHPWIVRGINFSISRVLKIPINIDTGEWSMNCSETVTRILRAGGLNVCPGVDADCVTPMDLYRYLTADAVENIKIQRGNVKMTTTITVKNSAGTVLSGATISYIVSGTSVEGTTDTNGQLAISDLPAGTYTFTATLNGYTSTNTSVTVDGTNDAAGTITMTAETVESAATDAAKESLSESLTTESSSLITYLTNLADERIAMWEADSKRTSDNFVKFRNTLWIADLKAAKALVKTGGTVGIALLVQKLAK